jgi:hypothetical protein
MGDVSSMTAQMTLHEMFEVDATLIRAPVVSVCARQFVWRGVAQASYEKFSPINLVGIL